MGWRCFRNPPRCHLWGAPPVVYAVCVCGLCMRWDVHLSASHRIRLPHTGTAYGERIQGSSRPPPTRGNGKGPASLPASSAGICLLFPLTEKVRDWPFSASAARQRGQVCHMPEERSRTCSTVVCRPLQWLHLILSTMFALRPSGVGQSTVAPVGGAGRPVHSHVPHGQCWHRE